MSFVFTYIIYSDKSFKNFNRVIKRKCSKLKIFRKSDINKKLDISIYNQYLKCLSSKAYKISINTNEVKSFNDLKNNSFESIIHYCKNKIQESNTNTVNKCRWNSKEGSQTNSDIVKLIVLKTSLPETIPNFNFDKLRSEDRKIKSIEEQILKNVQKMIVNSNSHK